MCTEGSKKGIAQHQIGGYGDVGAEPQALTGDD